MVHQKTLALYEARLVDVPFPLDANFLGEESEDLTKDYLDSFTVQTDLSLQDITRFYEQEMERLGWKTVFIGDHSLRSGIQTEAQELNFLYEKPCKYCLISARPASSNSWSKQTGHINLHYFLIQKKSPHAE